MHVSIPANTKARAHIPAEDLKQIRENGKPISNTADKIFRERGRQDCVGN